MKCVYILVRIVDKKGVAAVDASERGDVIAVMPAGTVLDGELSNPEWRVICTRVPDTFVEALMSSVMSSIKRRRDWSIDLDRLPNPELYRDFRTRTRAIIDVDSDHLLRTTRRKMVA